MTAAACASALFLGLGATASAAPHQAVPAAARHGIAPAALTANDLSLTVTVSEDGTADFSADDTPGNDSGSKNGIVRVNDTVTYALEYVVRSATADNLTFSVTLPKGMEVVELPGYCTGAGSSVSPKTAGAASLPLKANSLDELSSQTVTCNVGTKEAATDKVYLTAKVSNLVPNGQALTLTAASVTADGLAAPVPATSLPSVTASSRLKWDVSKNSIAPNANGGYVYGPAYSPCPWDKSTGCFITGYTVQVSSLDRGKGAMPATGDITVTDDLSFEGLYPQLSPEQINQLKADPEKYGSRAYPSVRNYLAPGSKVGITENGVALTATNAVPDSGTLVLDQPGGPGTPVTMTIKNPDTSLRTVPTQAARPAGTALPADRAYAVALAFDVYTPAAVVKDFGLADASGTSWTLPTENRFKDLDITGLAPTDKQATSDQPEWNDSRRTNPNVSVGGAFTKYFAGVPGAPGNMTPTEFVPGDRWLAEGPVGGATERSGGITAAPGQEILSLLYTRGSNPLLPTPISTVMCDAWDNTKLHLKAKDYPASTTAGGQSLPSGGSAVWVSGYNNLANEAGTDARDAVPGDQVPAIKVQYSAMPGATGETSRCGEEQGPWYDDPAQVPGNDPARAAEGVYTGVARVRVHTVLPEPVGAFPAFATGFRMQVAIGLEVADSGEPAGTPLPNWAAFKRVIGSQTDLPGVISAKDHWNQSTYDPTTHVGIRGDRLLLADVQARIDKTVRKGDSGDFSKTPPSVTGYDTVQYQLKPSLSSAVSVPGQTKELWVEDCLPDSQDYTSASVEPALVSKGSTPDDAKRPACSPGQTYIRWVIPSQEVNAAIEPIILTAEVSPTARDGVHTNRVQVWAQGDASTPAQRTSAADVQISNIAGVKLEKVALTPVVQVNREGQATDELNKWRIRLTNTLPGSDATKVEDPEIIDVLPRNGVGDTDFTGAFTFVEAEVLKGAGVTIQYTSAAQVAVDPKDPTNGANGTTAWCDAPAGGAVVTGTGVCPASAAEVTAVRVRQPGVMASRSVIELDLSMRGVGDSGGDSFVNTVAAAATGLENTVGPLSRPERAIASSIGDRFWVDENGNGIQDSGERGVSDAEVALTGVDDLGNPVKLSTRTDSAGNYAFTGLRSSDAKGYTVAFTIPQALKDQGYEFTATTTGDDRELDSDADGQGVAAAVVMPAGTDIAHVDAGIVRPSIALVKAADVTEVAAGEVVTYTFTATNDGHAILSGVTLSEDSFTNAQGQRIALDAAPALQADQSTGTPDQLAPGQTLVWTARYTVKAEDLEAGKSVVNAASVTGTSPRGTEVKAGDDESVSPKGTASFEFSKTADPATGGKVAAGDKISYTVTVRSRGDLPVRAARISDDLSKVLDDAVYNSDVQATSGDASIENGRLSWTGDLAKDQEVTITYSVTVKEGGDAALTNTATTDDDRGACDDAVGCTTEHTLTPAAFVLSKTADPASGSEVAIGGTITYTLTVRHAGGGAVAGAAISDDLSKVLDDADYNGDVRATSGDASIENDRLSWTGDLAKDQEVTITYSVTVKEGGNKALSNTATTTDKRGRCDDAVGCATEHTVAAPPKPEPSPSPTQEPTQAPTVAPSQGSTEAPSQEPSQGPSQEPTEAPSQGPTEAPSQEPTEAPSQEPSGGATESPTAAPSQAPSATPTADASADAGDKPTGTPSPDPSQDPTSDPSADPTSPAPDGEASGDPGTAPGGPEGPGSQGPAAPGQAGDPASSAVPAPGSGPLASTGAAVLGTLLMAGLALIAGAALLRARRRED
ncbi:DUF7927 domain-containing protein [Actinomyces capricornis]|uniref:DUF7927 domain-containing protein n=1 Tax=Actinomyces capricornis TaxID=2755559 RepID=UPI001CC50FF4|nr:SdrD B-like domain-containing protein [Actinomyces capricornis]